ncbi:MAG: uroporphyrinogen-III synthase [Candidatus Binatia bacterium]
MVDTSQLGGLDGLRVVTFESRRATEIAELIRRHGGEPILAPSVQEVPLDENSAAFEFVRRLEAGAIDVVVLMTGVGLRTLVETVAGEWPRERLAPALARATVVARGPKPAAALRELGLQADIIVPEPNTWREILAALDAELPVAGKRIAVQEYGVPSQEFLAALEARGADVLRVPVYRWALPEDIGPLRAAIHELCGGTVDVALFTSATQVHHLFQVAADKDEAERLRAAFAKVLLASIGPVCSEALREHGLSPDLEPEHAKMGQLVGEVARRGRAMLDAKRRSASV